MRPIKHDLNIIFGYFFAGFRNSPYSIQGGETLLDRVWRPGRLALGISDAHVA